MADITEILRVVVDVAAERNAALEERDAARAEVERLRAERDAARAQLQADDQRAWETLGKPEGTYDTTHVQRLCAEVERLRSDMREAMGLLRAASPNMGDAEWDEWGSKVNKLLAKHEEPNQ